MVKTIPGLTEAVVRLGTERAKPGQEIGLKIAELRNIEQMRHEVNAEGFTITVDEPPSRGGTDKGLNPLGFFLLGAASCFLTQLARVTIIKNLRIDTLEMTARAHFGRVSHEFIDMIYDVRLTGQESTEGAIGLLHEAEKMCYVHQTLKKAIPLTAKLSMNGEIVATHTIGPQSA